MDAFGIPDWPAMTAWTEETVADMMRDHFSNLKAAEARREAHRETCECPAHLAELGGRPC